MKKISRWAKSYKWTSRIIIVASFMLIDVLALVTGILLGDLHVSLSSVAMFVFLCFFLGAAIAYPSRPKSTGNRKGGNFYVHQKVCDIILAASTFCMITCWSNQQQNQFSTANNLNAMIVNKFSLPKDSTMKAYKTINAFMASMKDESGKNFKWKERKRLLKEQVRNIRHDKDMDKGEKIALMFLSWLVALGLFFLVASLACDLSCSGSDGAAFLVFFGGTAAIILLLSLALKGISKKHGESPQKTISTQN